MKEKEIIDKVSKEYNWAFLSQREKMDRKEFEEALKKVIDLFKEAK